MANRLAGSLSPYLLQHADNPVDWWEWGDEAFDGGPPARRARAAVGRVRRVPLVPRHGARVVRGRRGRGRGQRPLRRGQGRPRGAPRRRRRLHGGDDGAHRARRLADDLPAHARRRPLLRRHLPAQAAAAGPPRAGRARVAHAARPGAPSGAHVAERLREVIPAHRRPVGSTPAPATPPSRRLRTTTTTPAAASAARPSSRRRWCSSSSCATTPGPAPPTRSPWCAARCAAMARGGMYDQLGGGFARYAVDAGWVVPHFEKMLYDNACSCGSTPTCGARPATGSPARRRGDRGVPAARPAHRRVASRRRSTRTPSSTATPTRASPTPGPRPSSTRCSVPRTAAGPRSCSRSPHGHLRARVVDLQNATPTDAVVGRTRTGSSPPGTVGRSPAATTRWSRRGTGWPSPRWPTRACCSTSRPGRGGAGRRDFVLATPRRRRGAPPPSRGVARGRRAAVLEDHGDLAEGLLALHQATGGPAGPRPRRCSIARSTGSSTPTGTVHDTAHDAPGLFSPSPAGRTDNAEPSGRVGARRGPAQPRGPHRIAAPPRRRGRLSSLRSGRGRSPRFAGWALAVAEAAAAGPLQVAVVGDGPAPALLRVARRASSPVSSSSTGCRTPPGVPLLADRPLVEGRPAAYVCRASSATARHLTGDLPRVLLTSASDAAKRADPWRDRSTAWGSPGLRPWSNGRRPHDLPPSRRPFLPQGPQARVGPRPAELPRGTEEDGLGRERPSCDRRHLGTRHSAGLPAARNPVGLTAIDGAVGVRPRGAHEWGRQRTPVMRHAGPLAHSRNKVPRKAVRRVAVGDATAVRACDLCGPSPSTST